MHIKHLLTKMKGFYEPLNLQILHQLWARHPHKIAPPVKGQKIAITIQLVKFWLGKN